MDCDRESIGGFAALRWSREIPNPLIPILS
jgi:hypothetical protein